MHPYILDKSQKIIWLILLVSVLGLAFMPLLPWIATGNVNTLYIFDTSIHDSAKSISASDEIKACNTDLFVIGLAFTLSLIFGIIALIGLYMVKSGGRYMSKVGCALLLTGIALIIFGILSVVFHGLFFKDANAITGDTKFFYNYIPLIFSIILLISTIMYVAIVVPNAVRSLLPSRPMYPPTQQPYQQPQPPYQQP